MDYKNKKIILKTLGCVSSAILLNVSHAAPPTPDVVDQSFGPGSERQPVPEFEKPAELPQFELPPVKKVEPAAGGQVLRAFIKKFEVKGNTVFSDEEIGKITAPYENRNLTTVEIQEVRQKITLFYINNGYINSGAILPDQKVSDGIVKLQIIEGELTTINVKGNDGLNSEYISDRLALGGQPPLNLKSMQQQLRFMQQNPLIKRVNAQLNPGNKPGESILNVLVEENSPYTFAAYINNFRSPSVGSIGLGIEATTRNLTGNGDRFSVRLGKTEGLQDWALSYALPLNAQDTTFRFRYEGSDSEVVEEPFIDINIESESKTFGVELTHPVYKTPNEDVILGIGFDYKKSESYLNSVPFPFSLGTEDGLSKVSVLRLSQRYSNRTQNDALSLRSVFSFGIDAFDATIHDTQAERDFACGMGATVEECPDGDFAAWLGQVQYARRFSAFERNMSVILRADAQLAGEPLLPAEQFSIGGARTVRGYRENQLVRDNGFLASVELRIPLQGSDGPIPVQLVPFVDYGRSWNRNRTTPEPTTLSSAGIGVIWSPDRHWQLEAYAAKNFHKIVGESDEHDLQDSGIHFQLSYNY